MNRRELEEYILKAYNVSPKYPWKTYKSYGVFCHEENKKWFALIMNISKDKIGIKEEGTIDIVNLKCEEEMLGSFLETEGFYPAYHMNKEKWISVALDGSAKENQIKMLLEKSFEMTKGKTAKKPL